MINQNTLDFLKKLEKNNNKEWFHSHKAEYQEARGNFLEVTQRLINEIGQFDEEIKYSELESKKCVMRINRDIRFSKDKSPYKTNFFAFINPGGKKNPTAGYYFSLKPGGESFIGGGVYMMEKNAIKCCSA